MVRTFYLNGPNHAKEMKEFKSMAKLHEVEDVKADLKAASCLFGNSPGILVGDCGSFGGVPLTIVAAASTLMDLRP